MVLASSPKTDAVLRTTVAQTMIHSGVKANVLPSVAWAVVNTRIIPGETIGTVSDFMRQAINDPRVKINPDIAGCFDPSPKSSAEAFGYKVIEKSVRQVRVTSSAVNNSNNAVYSFVCSTFE
eukprot:m.39695 g.39695  ORF g.39695 m.39695 type:complete len:122 (-) comp10344_c0_seq3:713-1078(-)